MKPTIAVLLALILIGSVVIAACPQCGQQNQSGQETGQGQQLQTGQQTGSQWEEQLRARNVSELRVMIQEKEREMEQEMANLGEVQQEIYRNQNRVRLSVHSLLAMENLTGGIGRNVSQIAREFNNSVQATIRAEERIRTRSGLLRFFLGGDQETAEEMEQEVSMNRERIQQLTQLRQQCNCSEEVRAMLQENIQAMEQEQNRLQQLSQNEKQNRGIFGWILGLFGR